MDSPGAAVSSEVNMAVGVDVSSEVNMAVGVDVLASDWNNRIREAIMKLSAKIPKVGAVVSLLIGFLWPQHKVDIFQALKADVMKLVKKGILDYELNLHESEIDALKITIQRYEAAKTNEKAYFLNTWITDADKLSVIFRQSNNNIHLILPVITLALLHLTGLRERLDFGKELYDEDNTEQWKKDLEEMYKTYIVDFLPVIFQKWKLWRADQVEINAWTETHPMAIPPYFRIESHATVVETMKDLTDSTTIFASICKDHKTRMCNDAAADMAGCISTTFVFDKLLPDNNRNELPRYDKVVFGRMYKGPYSQDLLLSEHNFGVGYPVKIFRSRPDRDDYTPSSGPITKVIIREWNSIDAMQFIYANRDQGHVAGNSGGGLRHDIDVTEGKPMRGLHMGFSNGVLTFTAMVHHHPHMATVAVGDAMKHLQTAPLPTGPVSGALKSTTALQTHMALV